MSEEEKNVYKSLFEYPTKIIAGLEKENQQLKEQLKQIDEVIDEAIEYIENHSRKEPPFYEFLGFYNNANLSELYDILQKCKGGNK